MLSRNFLAILLCMIVLTAEALAQVTTGTILGTVTDSTGAVLPGVSASIINVETGLSRTALTDTAGRYRASELPVGKYEVSVELAGFQKVVRTGIELTVGRQALVDFTLQVGAVAESVTVTGEAPLIETTNATVANLVTEKEMRELPLNGRSFTDLTAIQPGAVTDLGIPAGVFQGGGRIVLNGARATQSLYLLDGVEMVSPSNNVAPVSVMNQTLGVDTIREFTVIQNNYGAQYGRAIGGIVNSVTRSGTNQIHGSGFEFFRTDNLDAKNFFDIPDEPIPAYKRNQFGGTLGGPIVRDKTHFFFSYEGLRQSRGTTDNGFVLSDEARTGQISGCPAGLQTCTKDQRIITSTVSVNADIRPIIDLIPRGNGLYLNDGLQEFKESVQEFGRENYYMTRVDHRLTDNDSIFGRLVMDTSSKEVPDSQFLDVSKNLHTFTNDWGAYTFLALEWTRILSPSVINVARAGFTRNNNNQCMCIDGEENKRVNAEDYPGLPPQLAVVPGVFWGGPWGVPGVSVPGGHNGRPGGTTLGADLDDPLMWVDNTFSYADSVRITKGSHSLDLGVDIRRYQQNTIRSVRIHGNASWAAPMANFLTAGACSGCQGYTLTTTAITGPADVYRGWRQTYGAWYVQDDIRLLSNLTLNIGARWEKVTGPVEVNGKAAVVKDTLRDTGWTRVGKEPLFSSRDILGGFEPRFGFAYSPDSVSSVRGGFGLFKEMPLEYLYQGAIYYPPWADRILLRNVLVWPNPLIGGRVNTAAGTPQPQNINTDIKYPYGMQWNFGIQRQIGGSWVGSATYTGTRGVSLVGVIDQIQPAVQTDAQGLLFTPNLAPPINPALDSTRTYANLGDSIYNALGLRLQKRFSHGLEFSVSYTWSKNIGTGVLGLNGAGTSSTFGSGFTSGNLWNYKEYDRSLLDQDVRNNFSLNYTYELPIGQGRYFGSNMGRTANLIFGGWQINGIVSARSGLPVTITGGGYNVSNFCRSCSIRPLLKPGGNNDPVTGNINDWIDESQFLPVRPPNVPALGYFGNLGRNTLSGPRQTKVDFSIFKVFPVAEEKSLQFRAEFFNLPNHPNFAGPSAAVFTNTGAVSPTLGIIDQTLGTSRQIQLALKFEF